MNLISYATHLNPHYEECDFYHTMEIPGHSKVTGQWDLRPNIDVYVGHTDFAGKRVLEVGPASGFLTHHMEKLGADVVSVEIPISQGWDIVPRPDQKEAYLAVRQGHMRRLQNSFWFLHHAAKMKSQVLYSRVMDVPSSIGKFDVSMIASILLHSRDPMGILCKCAELTTKRMVITELLLNPKEQLDPQNRYIKLVPSIQNNVSDVWYQISPQLIVDLLMVLGFTKFNYFTHDQYYEAAKSQAPHYTLVAERET